MVADSMARFPGLKTVAAENIWEIGEEFLNLRWGEERCAAESRMRSRRGVEYHRLRTLSMNNIPPFDVDKEVKALQEICTKKRNTYWSQL